MLKSLLFSKQKEKENEKELLNKKRYEQDDPKDDIDMVKLKKKVNEIMISVGNSNNKDENSKVDYKYKLMHKNYILNEFTSNCLNFINKIIIDVKKNHLKKFQGIFDLNKIFISIIKELLMNEFELLLLSLYLESINLSLNIDIFTFKESLIYLCYFIKKLTLTTEKLSPINSFLNGKYQNFEDKFNKWFQTNSLVFNNKLYFSYAEINQRFIEYNIPHTIYCKNNYIDYNLIIDRILNMRIPYNEGKDENLFKNKKEKLNDLLLGNDNNNNINMNNNNNYEENMNNVNNLFFNSNNNYNQNNYNNNIKNINNLYNTNYITNYPNAIYLNNNNNINLDYLLNRDNIILNPINNKNEISINQIKQIKLNNKELLPINLNDEKNKINLDFKEYNIDDLNNINYSTINEENNKIKNKNKFFFIIESEDNKKKENKQISSDTNNNDIIKGEKKIKEEQKEISITPNNLLYSLANIDETPKNNKIDNNIHFNSTEKLNKQLKNNNISINNMNNLKNVNSIIRNNEGINTNQNNILEFQLSQNMNDYNCSKSNNLGLNDFNNTNQAFTFKNLIFPDINNFFHNSLNGIENEDNFKQLLNQSNENYFRSCLSINSSRNLYPILNNNNSNNNIRENGNMNYQYIPENPSIQNLNAGLNNNMNFNNNGKNFISQDKKFEMIDNKNSINNDNNENNNEK